MLCIGEGEGEGRFPPSSDLPASPSLSRSHTSSELSGFIGESLCCNMSEKGSKPATNVLGEKWKAQRY